MESCVEFRGQGGTLVVTVVGYEREVASDESDANWLSCSANLILQHLSFSVAFAATTRDFLRFREQLSAITTSAGSATLATDEEVITIRLQRTAIGELTINAVMKDQGVPRSRVEVELLNDQTHVSDIRGEVELIVNRFPVRRVT